MNKLILYLVCLACLVPAVFAGNGSTGKLAVYSTIQPLAFIAEQIGGALITSGALIPQDKNHHSYIPTPQDLRDLRHAKLFFSIGMPVEEQFLKRSFENSSITVVDAAEGVKRLLMSGENACNDKDHHHNHGDESQFQDIHVWMSPVNNQIIASNICNALQKIDPANRAVYAANLAEFNRKLSVIDQELKNSLAPFKGRVFLVYHPAFGYFAEHYGLVQKAVEAGGKGPTPKQLEKLIETARADRAAMIFVQPQFNEKYAEVIAKAVNAKVVRLDPMQRDIFANYRHIATQIIAGMGKP